LHTLLRNLNYHLQTDDEKQQFSHPRQEDEPRLKTVILALGKEIAQHDTDDAKRRGRTGMEESQPAYGECLCPTDG
jgi:hypothetical protein